MTAVTFAVPWPPSVNHYWRTSRGIHHISTEGKAYRAATAHIVGEYVCAKGRVTRRVISAPMLGKLDVAIYAHPPDKRRRDLDNLLKSLLDALQHAKVYKDDYQIDRLLIERNTNIERATCLCVVKEFTGTPYDPFGE